jgi:hypothetical protein
MNKPNKPTIPLHQLKNKKMKKQESTQPEAENQNVPAPTINENIDMVVLWMNNSPNGKAPALKGFVNYPDGSRKEIVLWKAQSFSGNEYFRGRIQPERVLNENSNQEQPTQNQPKTNEENPPY